MLLYVVGQSTVVRKIVKLSVKTIIDKRCVFVHQQVIAGVVIKCEAGCNGVKDCGTKCTIRTIIIT